VDDEDEFSGLIVIEKGGEGGRNGRRGLSGRAGGRRDRVEGGRR